MQVSAVPYSDVLAVQGQSAQPKNTQNIQDVFVSRCGNLFLCIYIYNFLFIHKVFRVPIYLGLPPTWKVYCSYIPTFVNKNIRVNFCTLNLLKKSIFMYTIKKIQTQCRTRKKGNKTLNTKYYYPSLKDQHFI